MPDFAAHEEARAMVAQLDTVLQFADTRGDTLLAALLAHAREVLVDHHAPPQSDLR